MFLASSESKIKEWEYGSVKIKRKVTKSTLTVTNKRIIKTERSATKLEQQEIPISSVKSIHCTHDVPSKLGAILMIIFGILLMVVGAYIMMEESDYMIPAVVGVVLGLIMMIAGIKRLNQGQFSLVITTVGVEGESLTAGLVKWYKKVGRGGKMKVKINNAVVEDLIASLGAIVAEYRK